MKKLMVIGALLGFSTGLLFGLVHDSSWPSIIWRSSIACFVCGILMRWWGRVWINCLQTACQEKLAAEEAESQTAPTPAK